ncbi:MAG: methylmalonyl-CoA mutase, partial [Selenomonas sp.]|nr:methylmalonyl-CoA mutase [Selenomonas sp.]
MMSYQNPDFTQMSLREPTGADVKEWEKLFSAQAGAEFDSLTRRTMEHIPVKPLYNHDEYDHMNHLDFASGIPPCLRGPYSTMYVFRPWTV